VPVNDRTVKQWSDPSAVNAAAELAPRLVCVLLGAVATLWALMV